MGNGRLLAFGTAVLLLSACTPETSDHGSTTPTTTTSSSPTVAPRNQKPALPPVAAQLRPPPTDCAGPAPDPQPVVRFYGSLEGEEPIWGGIYAHYRPEHQAFYVADARPTRYGYPVKVLWIIHPRHKTPVTIEGTDLTTGKPIFFDVEGSESPARLAHLDPNNPGTVPEHNWKEYPSYLFFGSAGCYELKASWSDGSWRRVFGFGRS